MKAPGRTAMCAKMVWDGLSLVTLHARHAARAPANLSHNLRTRICHCQLGDYNYTTRRVLISKN
jgi:hypothetical protein